MAMLTAQHYNHTLHLFTGVTVFAIFLLVCYTAMVTSLHYQRDKLQDRTLYSIEVKRPPDKIPKFSNRTFMAFLQVKTSNQGRYHVHPSPVNSSSNFQCKKKYCTEYLGSDDHDRLNTCTNRVKSANTGSRKILKEGICHFINQTNRAPAALVSLPGSGNTWIRGLLEKTTGICTGAVYCDISLKASGFVGENICSGSVLVVKTHEYRPKQMDDGEIKIKGCTGAYESIILLVRNPFHALVAEWNRKVANGFHKLTVNLDSHTSAVGKEWFGKGNVM